MSELLWKIKVILRQRRCVRCGKLLFGEAESVNVYDRVVGRHKGIKCLNPCVLKIGSPEWVKKYWIGHAIGVLLKPDYFGKDAYLSAFNDYKELITEDEKLNRFVELFKYLNKKYPNKWDKLT